MEENIKARINILDQEFNVTDLKTYEAHEEDNLPVMDLTLKADVDNIEIDNILKMDIIPKFEINLLDENKKWIVYNSKIVNYLILYNKNNLPEIYLRLNYLDKVSSIKS